MEREIAWLLLACVVMSICSGALYQFRSRPRYPAPSDTASAEEPPQPASEPSLDQTIPPSDIAVRVGSWENVKFALSCQFPDAPAEIPRLKVVGGLTPELVRKVAEEVFGLTGEVGEHEGDMWIQTEGRRLEMFSSGSFLYTAWRAEPIVHLTEEEARAVAEDVLRKIRTYGLRPRHGDITTTFHSILPSWTGRSHIPTENGWVVGEEKVYQINVNFASKFRNFPMRGVGVTVGVGENGWLQEVGAFWKEIEVDGSVRVVTPQQAFQRLVAGVGVDLPRGRFEEVIIKGIELGYCSRGPAYGRQDYLMPAYIFHSTLVKGGESYYTTLVVPAAVEEERTTVPAADNAIPAGPRVVIDVERYHQSGPPGSTLVYKVGVANVGDVADAFDLRVEGGEGWVLTLEATSVTVPARSRRVVNLSVTVPRDALPGQRAQMTVIAASRTDPGATSSFVCTAVAEAIGWGENAIENVA